jgi:hypothetical protein
MRIKEYFTKENKSYSCFSVFSFFSSASLAFILLSIFS